MLEIQQITFWGPMDAETEAFVQAKTTEIHARMNRTAEDVIAIGRMLEEVKARLPYGQFVEWFQAEFDMTVKSAQRFMSVAKRFGGRDDIMSFLPTVLYELAMPSTPDEVVEQVTTGQIPASLPAIREAKAARRTPEPEEEEEEEETEEKRREKAAYLRLFERNNLDELIALDAEVIPTRDLNALKEAKERLDSLTSVPSLPVLPLPPPPTDDAYAHLDDIRQVEAETEREAEHDLGYAFRLYMRGKLLDFQKLSDEIVTNALTTSDQDDVADFEAICDEAITWLSHVKGMIQSTRHIRLL